jgi:hypothetical protein
MVLPPCFPYFFAILKVLDLGDQGDQREIAGYIYRIMEFISTPYDLLLNPAQGTREIAISKSEYYLKDLNFFF